MYTAADSRCASTSYVAGVFGLVTGLMIGALLAANVMAQPASLMALGPHLVWLLIWLGVVYGASDALLLNVLPVWIVEDPHRELNRGGWLWRSALPALVASLLVTAAYHLGYSEFRGRALLQPLIGNALMTLGFLVTGSPAAAIVGHVLMHAAAVLHGLETTVQLPLHY